LLVCVTVVKKIWLNYIVMKRWWFNIVPSHLSGRLPVVQTMV